MMEDGAITASLGGSLFGDGRTSCIMSARSWPIRSIVFRGDEASSGDLAHSSTDGAKFKIQNVAQVTKVTSELFSEDSSGSLFACCGV